MSDNKEMLEQTNKLMQKLAGHSTDEELAKEPKPHPKGEVDEEVGDIGAAGVDGSEKDRTDKGKTKAHPSEETSMKDTPSEGVGDHETDKKLKDESSKTAALVQQFRQSGQNLQSAAAEILKAAQDDSEDKDSDKDSPPDSVLEETSKEKEKDESGDDDDEDDDKDKDTSKPSPPAPEDIKQAEEAGRLAAENAATGIDVLMEQQKSAAIEEDLRKCAEEGVHRGIKLAQALDAEAEAKMQSEPAMEESSPQAAGGQVVPEDEIAAIIQLLESGKEPETDLEKRVAEMIGLDAGSPEGGDKKPESGGEEGEGSEEDPGSNLKEEIGASEKVASMDSEQFRQMFKEADPKTQVEILSRAMTTGE